MYNPQKVLLSLILPALLSSCAQQAGPTGGPKDVAPPLIIKSEPLNFSTGFQGNIITIKFNEFIQVKDFYTQLIISPPLSENPKFRIKGKTIELSFNDTLHSNTTYSFQFGDGITDITEGNPLDSNLFVFSTGNHIDSLTVQGRIKNAFNLSPEKQVLVMLYSEFEDSLPYRSRPLYFAKTKEDGTFRISYLRDGSYKLFALRDGNSNYLFDQPEEHIGFYDLPVSAGDSAEKEIMFFQEDLSTQFLKRAYAEHFAKIIFAFAKPVEKSKVIALNRSFKKEWYVEEWSEKKDTLTWWLTALQGPDTLQMQVWDDNQILDTAEIILPEKEKQGKTQRKGAALPEKLVIKTNGGSAVPFDLYETLRIETAHPVNTVKYSEILLMEKNDTLKIKPVATDKTMRKFEIEHSWKEATEYSLFIPPGAFTDIYTLSNDTFRVSFKTRKKDEYGKINLDLVFDTAQKAMGYIIQLMDKSENILREKQAIATRPVQFEKVLTGQYKIKLIYDRNKNSKWDTGNYLKNLQPEKVIYYSSPVELRPKFDLDLEWKLNANQ